MNKSLVNFRNERTGLEFGLFDNEVNADNIARMRKDPEFIEVNPKNIEEPEETVKKETKKRTTRKKSE